MVKPSASIFSSALKGLMDMSSFEETQRMVEADTVSGTMGKPLS